MTLNALDSYKHKGEKQGSGNHDGPYDLYANRTIALPNTFFGALIHMFKSSMGSGILAVPSAIAAAGIITGTIGTIFTGIVCAHAIYIMIYASLEMCRKVERPSLTFAETAQITFQQGPPSVKPWANFAGMFVDIGLITTYFAGNAVYVVFICSNIQDLTKYHYPETGDWPPQWYMLMILVPLILFCQIRELKHLVPLSFVANMTMITAFLITLYYMCAGIGDIDLSTRKLVNKIELLPSFFSTILFAMEGIGTMLPIENSMVEYGFLGRFGVLNLGMAGVTGLYTTMGIFGYLRFGDDVGANIIASLDAQEIAAQIAKACIAISVFLTFMLQFYVPCDIVWRKLRSRIPEKHHNIAQIVMRTILVCLVTTIAAAVPRLDVIIDLVGSIFLSTLGLMVTVVIDTVRIWGAENDTFGKFYWKLSKNLIILFLWLVALISGATFAIQKLVK